MYIVGKYEFFFYHLETGRKASRWHAHLSSVFRLVYNIYVHVLCFCSNVEKVHSNFLIALERTKSSSLLKDY